MERRADAPTTKRAKSGRSIATAQLPRRRSYGTAKDIAAEVQGGTHLRRCSWRQALRRRAMPICRHFSMHAGRPGAGTRMDARCGECNASERRHAEVRVTTSTRPADGCLYRAVCRHDCMDWCPSCKDATIPSLRQQDVTPGTSVAGDASNARLAAAWHVHARQGQHGVVHAVLSWCPQWYNRSLNPCGKSRPICRWHRRRAPISNGTSAPRF